MQIVLPKESHVIAEIVAEMYDIAGRQIAAPTSRKGKRLFSGTFPMGRYVSQPLRVKCNTIRELRQFLKDCKYVSDKEQFHRDDYWMPPEEFEKTKKGDCDDFALWTWRQLLDMGYKARYVVGRAGRYGDGHAWVTFEKDGKHFIIEPLSWFVGDRLPRLSFVRYVPSGSVEWDGKHLKYFTHEKPQREPRSKLILTLFAEWVWFWACFWGRFLVLLCMVPYLSLRNLIKRLWGKKKTAEPVAAPDRQETAPASR
jgi:predicted transglutaminase-like cysteine proteinase